MQMTLPQEELQILGLRLQTRVSDIGNFPLGIRCVLRDGKLVVLGQHPANVGLDPMQTLRMLERQIQALQIRFTQQVWLYLRIAGQEQPYASRRFMIQPPPPPPNPVLCQGPPERPVEERWIPDDDELDLLLGELVASRQHMESRLAVRSPVDSAASVESAESAESVAAVASVTSASLAIVPLTPTAAASDLVPLSLFEQSVGNPTGLGESWMTRLDRRAAIATGTVVVGLVGGIYALSRPCSMGTCPELELAQDLGDKSIAVVQQSQDRADLETAQGYLGQAMEMLETIPLWSGQVRSAHGLIQTYQARSLALDQLIAAADEAAIAQQRSQSPPYSVAEWDAIADLWRSALHRLDEVESDSEFYAIAQQTRQDYRNQLATAERRLQQEQQAQQALNNVKETVKLAEARQKIAQSLANWQLARATWQVVIMRLQEISPDTLAARDARQLLTLYQPQLAAVHERVEQEQTANQRLEQATRQAARATEAESQFDWQQAVAEWDVALNYANEVPVATSSRPQAEALITTYKSSREQASQRQQMTERVSTDLNKACTGELQFCRLMSVDSVIRVRLDSAYVDAIAAARSSGNRDLQAVVAQHQLNLRRSLADLASRFDLAVEVYDPSGTLLERHQPQ